MNWLEKMNRAMAYIEENLAGEIDYGKAAKQACSSMYQFQRIFSFVADVPLAEYIRRRRMTLAAFDLQNSTMKVVDIALKYGYESPESFARMFQIMHGVTPTLARCSGTKLKAYPRISFQISIRGDVEMDYRIEKMGELFMQGVEYEFDMKDEENCYQEIPKIWNKLCSSGECDKMVSLADLVGKLHSTYPVRACSYTYGTGTKFCYMIGIVGAIKNEKLTQYNSIEIAAGTWAVFTSETVELANVAGALQKLNKRIYSEWLPTSKYEQGNYQQELYFFAETGQVYCEIWVQVQAK